MTDTTKTSELSVVLIGSPMSGFQVYGPFDTLDDAEDWAGNLEDAEGWAVQVIPLAQYR